MAFSRKHYRIYIEMVIILHSFVRYTIIHGDVHQIGKFICEFSVP